MSFTIIWSPTARITYYQVLDYLNEEWTFREIENFIDRTEEALTHICQNPSLYPYSEKSDAYKCVLVRQVSLFYRLKDERIELLIFWDNRSNPSKLHL